MFAERCDNARESRRRVTLFILVACLSAALTAATIALFQDREAVDDGFVLLSASNDPIASVVVIQRYAGADGQTQIDTSEYGDAFSDAGFAPGAGISRNPVIKNAGKHDMWVRMNVTFSGVSRWESVLGRGFDLRELLSDIDPTLWVDVGQTAMDKAADTVTYTWYWRESLAPQGETDILFSSVVVPTWLNSDQVKTVDGFQVILEADGLQTEHTGESAQEAFDGFWT